MDKSSRTALECERMFMDGGPFFHLYTKPLENNLILRTTEDMDMALNCIALSIFDTTCILLAFALMNNHFHFILEGAREKCLAFYNSFQDHLNRHLSSHGRKGIMRHATPELAEISSLYQLRNEIVYVCRNPFVDRVDVNVFSYKWCSAYLYFNGMDEMMRQGEAVSEWSVNRRRAFRHGRQAEVDPRIRVLDGVALPSCFTDYNRTMSFFENARQYVNWMLKSVESQMEIARRLGDKIVLSDTELWQVVMGICKRAYALSSPRELSSEQRTELARKLKFDYNASNAQIARCTGTPRSVIDQIFPLSARQT